MQPHLVSACPPPLLTARFSSFPGPFVLFSLLLALNVILPSFPSTCYAARKGENQRVDTPSLDDTTYLMVGPEYAFTDKTPIATSTNPREYVDGMLATQKIIAAPIIPIDRQSWPGVDATRSYFGRGRNVNNRSASDPIDYGKQRIEAIPNVLRSGMRKLVLDLWWDPVMAGWQICPRINRDASTMQALSIALQHLGEEYGPQSADGMSSSLQAPILQPTPQQQPNGQPRPQSTTTVATHATVTHTAARVNKIEASGNRREEFKHDRLTRQPRSVTRHSLWSLAGLSKRVVDSVVYHPSERKAHKAGSAGSKISPTLLPSSVKNHAKHDRGEPSSTTSLPAESSMYASSPDFSGGANRHHKRSPQRPAMSKSHTSTYDSSYAIDRTIDGITCTTGEDLTILLQALQSWVLQTSDDELVDVLMIVINLNELNTAPTRPNLPTPSLSSMSASGLTSTPTATSSLVNSNAAAGVNAAITQRPDLSDITSLNTNSTILAALPRMTSLHQIFADAFPHMVYTPTQLQLDRDNLNMSWWKEGPVGLDYYNVTIDPVLHIAKTTTGWPTTKYLTDVVKTRVVVGFGNINLSNTTSYNMTDDLGLIFPPGLLQGVLPSDRGSNSTLNNTNLSGFLGYDPSLDLNHCQRPVPGVLMEPTGEEGNWTQIAMDEQDSSIQHRFRWGFANLADSSNTPWTYHGIKVTTTCGFSMLDQGGGTELSISDQAASTGWSWDLDQPPLNEITSRNKRCGVMLANNGRWAVQNCNLKLPVACRKIGTSGQWIVHKAGTANYRDVSCPDSYKFDVPRTARENQELYKTLLQFYNATTPAYFSALMRQQNLQQWRQQEISKTKPMGVLELYGPEHGSTLSATTSPEASVSMLPVTEKSPRGDDESGGDGTDGFKHYDRARDFENIQDRLIALAGNANGLAEGSAGMIWIDISSWQTAGCWVPGGTEGLCPYRAPDHTAAMQEIIKVSTIGGVIILILAGAFLYLKCRRNIRLRKASRRRSAVRTKILRTEVETVPA